MTRAIERPVNLSDAERPAAFAYLADPPENELDDALVQVPEYLTDELVCWVRRGLRVMPFTQAPALPAASTDRTR